MKKKKNWSLIAWISIYILAFFPPIASAEHPARVMLNFYADDVKDRNFIDPYAVSILALNEVEHGRHLSEVKEFILWYFSRLNYPDKHGLTGTIYDFVLENGSERSTGQYDSVDGYAGLFLHLLHRYAIKTGDVEFLRQNWARIDDIAYLIPFLQGNDGLTRALADSGIKYLMDNCEAYGGMSAYLGLRKLAGKGESAYHVEIRDALKKGVLKSLSQDRTALFSWAIENGKKSESAWNHFYPDAYAQLFPIYYDVLADMPKRKEALWRMFVSKHARKEKTFPVEQRIMFELTKKKMEGR